MPHPLASYAGGPQKPAYAASITVDWSLGDMCEPGSLTGNLTLVFVNASAGQIVTLVLTNGGATARTITWPSSVKPAGGATNGPPTSIAATNGLVVVYRFRFDGINYIYGG